MKERAPKNRTLTSTNEEIDILSKELISLNAPTELDRISGRIINQNLSECIAFLPHCFVDLLIIDPPYNLTKDYNGNLFRSRSAMEYVSWFEKTVVSLRHILKPTASIYVCSDWQTSNLIFPVLDRNFKVRNRITWEREKGRGAKSNWKNNIEDIWFCTVSEDYFFNVDAVKIKRRVIAPYRNRDGTPKDWDECSNGNYRITYPSNIWSDITVPFWSMPENTDHPTQKPEKLIAKLILASSREGDFVFDPFLGSGTTAVVARKLNRHFSGVEINTEYCCWAEKRLIRAKTDTKIQGYADGVFWERNTLNEQSQTNTTSSQSSEQGILF